MEDGDERLRRPSAQKIEIHRRNQLGHHIRPTIPSQDVPLQLRESHRAKPQPPQIPRRVQKIQVCARRRRGNRARHPVACFQQRPVERFPVECHEHRPLRHAFPERHEQRMFLAVLAHEKLLYLQPARVPPRQAHKECIRSAASRQSRRFRVQKKPLPRVPRFTPSFGSEQPKRRGRDFSLGRLPPDGLRKPAPQPQMLAETVPPRRCAQNFCQPRSPFGNLRRKPTPWLIVRQACASPRGLQRRQPRESIVAFCNHLRDSSLNHPSFSPCPCVSVANLFFTHRADAGWPAPLPSPARSSRPQDRCTRGSPSRKDTRRLARASGAAADRKRGRAAR